uniref:HAUS augmin-like complex subunit 5-like protein n=1 Tax=Callorhinchus milii TaxID=7868 RepID=V9KLF1_CALMI
MGRKDVAMELKRWAVEKMGFPPDQLPSDAAFASLCGGQCADIWKYVVHHVDTVQNVKTIRGNLSWYRHLEQSTSQQPATVEREKRTKLLRQAVALRAEIQKLDESLVPMQQEVVNEALAAEGQARVQEVKQRNLLLKAFQIRASQERKQLQERASEINHRLVRYRQISNKAEQDIGIGQQMDVKHKLTGPEPEVVQDLRKVCSTRLEFLQSLCLRDVGLSGGAGSCDLKGAVHQQWLNQVEGLLAAHPPNHLLDGLECLASENEWELQELASRVDVVGDLEDLRFNYSSCHLQDVSQPQAVLQTVKWLLEERWRDAERRATEKVGAVKREKELRSRLTSLARDINLLLDTEPESRRYPITRQQFERGLRVALETRYHEELAAQRQQLALSACERKSTIKSLQEKHQCILAFQELVDRKQDQIRALVKGTSSAKSHLPKARAEIHSLVDRKLSKHEGPVSTLTSYLHNAIFSEVQLFSSTPLPSLLLTPRDLEQDGDVPLELSINNTQRFKGLQQTLSFPLYKAPEYLLYRAAELRAEVMSLHECLCCQPHTLHQPSGSHGTAQALISRVQKVDDENQALYIPAIVKQLMVCEDMTKLSDALYVTLRDWWEQPGQFTVPWIRQNGLNVQQWIQRWSLAVRAVQQRTALTS